MSEIRSYIWKCTFAELNEQLSLKLDSMEMEDEWHEEFEVRIDRQHAGNQADSDEEEAAINEWRDCIERHPTLGVLYEISDIMLVGTNYVIGFMSSRPSQGHCRLLPQYTGH